MTPRNISRPLAVALSVVVSAAVVVAGCGSADTSSTTTGATTRAASAQKWPTALRCPNRYSTRVGITIVNLTTTPVVLQNGEVDCFDWSEDGNPVSVMNDEAVYAGDSRAFSLQQSKRATSTAWAMQLSAGSGVIGSTRVSQIDGTVSLPLGADVPTPAGMRSGLSCQAAKLGPDPAQQASAGAWGSGNGDLTVASDGTDILLATCHPKPGPAPSGDPGTTTK